MWNSKDVYYISDSTGILVTNLGQALICQFPEIHFHEEKFPFIRTVAQAKATLHYILKQSSGRRPIIFSTLMNQNLRAIFDDPQVEFFDTFEFLLTRLENCLEATALRTPGFSRHVDDINMEKRVEAIHFCLEHDDGIKLSECGEAEVILLGVSRSGKTPVSVYLSSHMGLKVANYPLTEEYLKEYRLPEELIRHSKKAVGLTNSPEMLATVRQKRYPNSSYASRSTCVGELEQAQRIFQKYKIPVIDTSGKSIEEIATQISQEIGIYKKHGSLNTKRG